MKMKKGKGKSLNSMNANKILSDGQVRDEPLGPISKPPGRPRTALGGKQPPARPIAKQTPRPSKQLAIGERPQLGKRMRKMGY
jgi:hypothetical protein